MSSRRPLRSIARGMAIGALLASLIAPAAAAPAETPRTNLPDIEDEVMCTICGTLLELSEAPQADRERALIRTLIDRGLTKEEIKDRLVAEYGSEVLAVPGDEGIDLAAWLVPGLALITAGAAIAVGLRRARARGGGGDDPPPIRPEDAERLDQELAQRDL
jgi:cytochrome c-type biogenesis protein CcmH